VAGGEDVNGDGVDDLLVGAAQFTAGRTGKAYVFLGPIQGVISAVDADAKLLGESRESLFGNSVAMPGDVNGDGRGCARRRGVQQFSRCTAGAFRTSVR
jgi:hypothetical protein